MPMQNVLNSCLICELFLIAGSGNSIPANETCVNFTDEISCYFKGSEELLDWNAARQLCNSLNATLPVIRNRYDQDAVAGYLRSNMNNSIAWTAGINFTYRKWTWVNEKPLNLSFQG